MRIASNEVQLKLEKPAESLSGEECESYFAWTNYFLSNDCST
jgi:hypothetical protein